MPDKRPIFTAITRGDRQFNLALKQFNAKARIKIIQDAMRAMLRPGASELRRATPRSSQVRNAQILRRKAKKGWKTKPKHAALAARASVKRDAARGQIVGRLGYRPAFAWYIQIITTGTEDGRIKARDFAPPIIRKYETDAVGALPDRIAKQIELAIARRASSKAK